MNKDGWKARAKAAEAEAERLGDLLEPNEPPNYRATTLEWSLTPAGSGQTIRCGIEVIKPGGKSSHELREALEAKVARLEQREANSCDEILRLEQDRDRREAEVDALVAMTMAECMEARGITQVLIQLLVQEGSSDPTEARTEAYVVRPNQVQFK